MRWGRVPDGRRRCPSCLEGATGGDWGVGGVRASLDVRQQPDPCPAFWAAKVRDRSHFALQMRWPWYHLRTHVRLMTCAQPATNELL